MCGDSVVGTCFANFDSIGGLRLKKNVTGSEGVNGAQNKVSSFFSIKHNNLSQHMSDNEMKANIKISPNNFI